MLFEKFTRKDATDFRQRYQGTYGYFHRGGKTLLVRLDKVDVDHNRVVFVDKDGLSYEVAGDADDDSIGFDFLPPKMAYHNTPSGTYLLRRIPQRQFSRGLSERNITIRTLSGAGIGVDFTSLHNIFERKIGVKEAYHRACDIVPGMQERSFAISPQFGIHLDMNALYCFHDQIGTVTTGGSISAPFPELFIKLQEVSLWGTEIRDALSRAGIKGTVV